MIKTPSSTVIGGAGIWAPGCTVLGSMQKTLDQLIKSMFANNEQGFTRTPDDLSTMYQDAAGTIPVTAAGQPIGLALDKSKGIVLGSELVTIPSITGVAIGGPAFTTYNTGATSQAGKWYEVSFNVSDYTGTGNVSLSGGTSQWIVNPSSTAGSNIDGNGLVKFKIHAIATAPIQMFTRSTNTCRFSNISVKEIKGNHAYQTTSSMRPLLVASPQRLDFDAVDDKLITNLPTQLTGCTVIRAVPNVGTQILTNQTIPTPYNDSTDHCGLIVINRALTTTETAQITRLFNKASGV